MAFSLSLLALAFFTMGVVGWRAPKDLKWWQTGIIYQVYPRSFKDSNGDGVGDLEGITSKLPYLRDLGVRAVWLSPIYPSPQADFGYDISNFIDVDETYGSLKDLDNLVEQAHDLGLKVVLDIVPNHASDEHAWFIASQDPNHPDHAKYKDYFIWHDGKNGTDGKKKIPNNWLSAFRGPAWTYSDNRQQFYLHQFHKKQPDLNFRNRDVIEEIANVLRFWMDHKVDGFRIDSAPFLFEDDQFRDEPESKKTDDNQDEKYLDHIYTQNLDEIYGLVQEWQDVVNERKDLDRVMMVEAYAELDDIMKYYGPKQRPVSSFPFNFLIITDLNQTSSPSQFAHVINKWMVNMNDDRWPNWVLGNHDRRRVATRYGPELADALNMLSLSLPGTAVTYYGEEIAMTDTFIRWEHTLDPQAINKGSERYLEVSRDPCRTPMQWDDTTSAGFSTNSSTWLPVNPNYWQLNVEEQSAMRSHLSVYRHMVEARKSPTMQRGDLKINQTDGLLIIERTLENEPTFMLVINIESRERNWFHPDLDEMTVVTSSLNSRLEHGDTPGADITFRPSSAVFLQLTSS